MKELNPNQQIVADDILRYKKNSLPANLALLGLVFNCLYFMLLYGIKLSTVMNNGMTEATRFSNLTMGFSVVLTLFMLLIAFLSSEGIKGYNKKYCIVLLALAAFQIFRIFGYPLYGLKNNYLTVNYFWLNPTESITEFIIMLAYLCASAACFVLAAVIGYFRCRRLEKHEAGVKDGSVNVENALKTLDEEESRAAAEFSEREKELVEEGDNA